MNDLLVPPHPPNTPPSKAQIILDQVSVDLLQLKDARKPGNNRQYSMHDAACSAFSVFYTQSPSFLSYQREMTALTGRNNVQSLFGAHDIPTLKIGGYHLEHNFGHGKKNLSNVLACLNLLDYLLHTACEWIDDRYRTLRFRQGSLVAFFHKFTALLDFFCFENWDPLIGFMFGKLRVDSG